jgi:RNA polymerase sigma-70 factor (sigma-E family)
MDFDEYVAARRVALVRTAVLLGARPADAEDHVQTALVRCLRSWRRVQRADHPDAYVSRVLVNVVRDAAARRWSGEVPTEALPEPAGSDPDLLTGLAVRRALATLSPDHREVLVLRFYLDLPERETALALGVAPGTVKSRTARALAALATHDDVRNLDAHR